MSSESNPAAFPSVSLHLSRHNHTPHLKTNRVVNVGTDEIAVALS